MSEVSSMDTRCATKRGNDSNFSRVRSSYLLTKIAHLPSVPGLCNGASSSVLSSKFSRKFPKEYC